MALGNGAGLGVADAQGQDVGYAVVSLVERGETPEGLWGGFLGYGGGVLRGDGESGGVGSDVKGG